MRILLIDASTTFVGHRLSDVMKTLAEAIDRIEAPEKLKGARDALKKLFSP